MAWNHDSLVWNLPKIVKNESPTPIECKSAKAFPQGPIMRPLGGTFGDHLDTKICKCRIVQASGIARIAMIAVTYQPVGDMVA